MSRASAYNYVKKKLKFIGTYKKEIDAAKAHDDFVRENNEYNWKIKECAACGLLYSTKGCSDHYCKHFERIIT